MVRLILVSTEFNWSGIVIENHGRAVSGMIRHHESPHTTVPYAVEGSSICQGRRKRQIFSVWGPSGCALQLESLSVSMRLRFGSVMVRWLWDNLKDISDLNTQWFQQLIDVTYMKIGWFLVELLMWVAFLVGALHGVGLCPVKTSRAARSLGEMWKGGAFCFPPFPHDSCNYWQSWTSA